MSNKARKFKRGDRVVFVDRFTPSLSGMRGIVTETGDGPFISVVFDRTESGWDPGTHYPHEDSLEHVVEDNYTRLRQMVEQLTDALDNVLTRVEKLERDAQPTDGRLPVGTKVRWLRGSRKAGQVGQIIGYMAQGVTPGGPQLPPRYAILFPDGEVWPCRIEPMGQPIIEVAR